MANGFVVAKLQSHILHTSKINSVSLTSRRKYKTNSSSPVSLKILNKVLGKTMRNIIGVEIILKCIQEYPCFTTKPFFTESAGHRHQKFSRNPPYSKFNFYDSAEERFNDNLRIETSDNKLTYTDMGPNVQTVENNKVRTKFYNAYFTKCIVQQHQTSDLNASEPISNPLKDPAVDQIEATYFSDNDNHVTNKSENKPADDDIDSKVQTIQYINKMKRTKFQKPYFTKCPGHYRQRLGSKTRFPLYSIPSRNPALDLTKAIYLSNKDNLVLKISSNKSTFLDNGSTVQTTEYNKGKVKFQKVSFTNSISQQKFDSYTPDSVYHNPRKDSATDHFEDTYFSDKDNLAIDKGENKTKYIDIVSKAQTIEYNKVKLKRESPYFTKCIGNYHQKPDSNAQNPMYPNPVIDPALDRIEATYILDKDNLAINKHENQTTYIDIGSKVQRIEYNKVKPKYKSPYFPNRTVHQNLDSNASEPMFSLYPIPSLTPVPARNEKTRLSDLDNLPMENISDKSVGMDARFQRIEYNKVKAKYVENSPSEEPDYGFNSVKRMHIVPKMPHPEDELERSDMIESQLKYNKVRPKYPDPKDSESL